MVEKKFKPIMIFHLVLMVAVLIFSIFSAVRLFGVIQLHSGMLSDGTTASELLSGIYALLYGIYKLLIAAALCFGIIYIWKEYRKEAAVYYKTFLVLLLVASAFSALYLFILVLVTSSQMALISVFAHIGKTIALFVLIFKKDLGKRNTWIVFFIILAMDIVIGCLSTGPDLFAFRIIGLISRLAMDGTIALAIRGKYEDKASRGTV